MQILTQLSSKCMNNSKDYGDEYQNRKKFYNIKSAGLRIICGKKKRRLSIVDIYVLINSQKC